mgnify:FL=1
MYPSRVLRESVGGNVDRPFGIAPHLDRLPLLETYLPCPSGIHLGYGTYSGTYKQ